MERNSDFRFLEDPRSSATFNKIYRPSYMRAIPFFAGFGCIVIVEKLKENKFKFSKVTRRSCGSEPTFISELNPAVRIIIVIFRRWPMSERWLSAWFVCGFSFTGFCFTEKIDLITRWNKLCTRPCHIFPGPGRYFGFFSSYTRRVTVRLIVTADRVTISVDGWLSVNDDLQARWRKYLAIDWSWFWDDSRIPCSSSISS